MNERRTSFSGRVTVVIGTYNRASYIDEAIGSMMAQTRKVDEILVIDDGSTDDTAQRVQAWGAPVRYLRKDNGGRSSALNHGILHASGDWLWLFDDDDVAERQALERFAAALEADPAAEFAYAGQILGRDGPDGRIVKTQAVPVPDHPPHELFHRALKDYPFRTQGALIHRRCFERVGLFDTSYQRGQDYEFVLRLLRRCRGVRVAEPAFVWRVHDGPRGPEHARHAGQQRVRVWMDYAGKLGRELRDALAPAEYLLHPAGAGALDSRARRRALVTRLSVMANMGLIDEMAADLRALAAMSAQALDDAEAMDCWRVPTYEYFQLRFFDAPAAVVAVLLAAAEQGDPGRAVAGWIGRGMLWSARQGDFTLRQRRQLGWAGLRLLFTARRWPRWQSANPASREQSC